jgi:hypothetical protein
VETQILPVRRYLAWLMAEKDEQNPDDWVDTHLFCEANGKPWEDSVLSSNMTANGGRPKLTGSSPRSMHGATTSQRPGEFSG